MIEQVDLTMVNWARATFALTAMYHWIFVPLTLGLSFLCAFFESIYVKTGDEQWKKLTRFWMTLFGINFAIGVATGIILEFEFGTNWSNYSWMVGDIFGAPLAVEGILAFFLEATFFAVMFFGWDRVSKGTHLFATWMVAIGSNLSAVWILIANGWMQYPVGMKFNPDMARFEMTDFGALVFSPAAISHFVHATSSGFLYASLFVVAVSSWYLLRKRHIRFAKRSLTVACLFGLLSSLFVAYTGDEHAYHDARIQPMKLAAMEGLYTGERSAGLVAVGLLNMSKKPGDDQDSFIFDVKIPSVLSLLANRDMDSFVPGIDDLVYGNPAENVMGVEEKMARGKLAVAGLGEYKAAKKSGDQLAAGKALTLLEANSEYLGYGYLESAEQAVPPVPTVFYAFRIMVALGTLFILLFVVYLYLLSKDRLESQPLVLKFGVFSILLGLIAGQAGWIVSELGRQPWAIQDLLPVTVASSNLDAGTVSVTFFMFLILFTALLIAELKIMAKQISIGPEGD
ncbi:cytochrome ubiquinol oxidase subunit I [uncultured Desulfuromusa sp.]|uniref:cytochrome ubiquinol oxidase subunit I n=1 Tax=uncultured Desulfuromusa sp. TaxID=219183 RepID=UPI002AA8D287|nr:cytochrome ubiquinol oxidase subunit I [uncultured Desulfuromusa sp.]